MTKRVQTIGLWVLLGGAMVVLAGLIYLGSRPAQREISSADAVEHVVQEMLDEDVPMEPEVEEVPPPAHPPDARWLSDATYIDSAGRMISHYDTDGDGLFDADEMLLYGTLRYDSRTRLDAVRIDLTPPGSVDFVSTRTVEGDWFREMAKRSLRPEEDTDGDGLPDAWEMHWFGHLNYGPWDDVDGDGFPNTVEWYRGTDPTRVDLLDPSLKPSALVDPGSPRTPWDLRWDYRSREFWEAQERARQRTRGQVVARE
jgi:hypothetical protein